MSIQNLTTNSCQSETQNTQKPSHSSTLPRQQTNSSSPPPQKPEISLCTKIGQIAQTIEKQLSPGDVASLRRLTPENPVCPALWKLIALYLPDILEKKDPYRERAEKNWAAIFSGMAHMQGFHNPKQRLGKVLSETGFSELRLNRLLRAKEESLLDTLRTVSRFLAAKGASVDWTQFAQLVLNQDNEFAEKIRRSIARDYFGKTENNNS